MRGDRIVLPAVLCQRATRPDTARRAVVRTHKLLCRAEMHKIGLANCTAANRLLREEKQAGRAEGPSFGSGKRVHSAPGEGKALTRTSLAPALRPVRPWRSWAILLPNATRQSAVEPSPRSDDRSSYQLFPYLRRVHRDYFLQDVLSVHPLPHQDQISE